MQISVLNKLYDFDCTVSHCISCTLYLLFTSVAWGIRFRPTSAPVRVVRGDKSWDINCPIPLAYCMLGSLASSEAYEFDRQAQGCHGSGNILFQMWISSFLKEPTGSLRGDLELQPQSSAQSSRNSLLSL